MSLIEIDELVPAALGIAGGQLWRAARVLGGDEQLSVRGGTGRPPGPYDLDPVVRGLEHLHSGLGWLELAARQKATR